MGLEFDHQELDFVEKMGLESLIRPKPPEDNNSSGDREPLKPLPIDPKIGSIALANPAE